MRYSLIGVGVLGISLMAPVASAYQASYESVTVPYEVVTIVGDPNVQQSILGDLSGSPEMFEIVSDVPFVLSAEIRAIGDGALLPDFSGIVIRQKELRGVEEVSRLLATDADWSLITEPATGLPYRAGPFYSEEVPAGTYRIEVSTPENIGKYILVIGSSKSSVGYFASFASVKAVYAFYNRSSFSMFSSPYVHYPIGILLLLVLLVGTWVWQRRRQRYVV